MPGHGKGLGYFPCKWGRSSETGNSPGKNRPLSCLVSTEPNKHLVSKAGWFSDKDKDAAIYTSDAVEDNGLSGSGLALPRSLVRSSLPAHLRSASTVSSRTCAPKSTGLVENASYSATLTQRTLPGGHAERIAEGSRFRRRKQLSWIDLTIANGEIAPCVRRWQVRDDLYTRSDQRSVTISAETQLRQTRELFPRSLLKDTPKRKPPPPTAFLPEELQNAMKTVKTEKALGPNGLIGKMVNIIYKAAPLTNV